MVTLRPFGDADLDPLFVWEQDPTAVRMAAFTHEDPSDRADFDAHYARIRSDPTVTLHAVEDDAGRFVGTVGSFTIDGDREVTYWIDPDRWGEGLATAALAALLELDPVRPIFGRVAEHNLASAAVLTRNGFVRVGEESAYAHGVGREVVEHVYRLGQ